MDFNALVSKLRSIEPTDISSAPTAKPAQPKAEPVVLSEDAQMRVLAGVSTIIAESQIIAEKAVSKSQQQAAGIALAAKKKGETPKGKGAAAEMAKMSTKELEKFAGTKHKGLPKKKTKESLEDTVNDILEAAKPDFLDVDKDGDKKEPMKKAVKDAKEKGGSKEKSSKDGMSDKQKKYFGKKDKSVEEGKYKSDAQRKAVHANKMKKEAVKESMGFLDAIKIVKESNGEMKIDAVDTALWNWAKRVASSKVQSGGLKAEAFAAKIYESYGGEWDVSRKIISE